MAGRNLRKRALKSAVNSGDLEAVKALCTEDPGLVSARTSYGNSALNHAISARQVAILAYFLDRDADPHQRNNGGWSLMDVAAGQGGEACVALLREHGVTYDFRHAVGLGDLPTVKARLEAEPELVDLPVGRRWSTPLHVAAREGQASVAALLLERGAAVDPRDKEGFTPLALLAAYGPRTKRPEVARVLVAHGANVHARCGYAGLDVLTYAASKRDRALITVLEG